jgi:hypothetical protein
MTLETTKELFGITHIGEEEVSLSHPVTDVVLPEEQEVPDPQGLAVTVPPKEDEVPVPQAPLSRSCWKKGRPWASLARALYRSW